MANNLQDVKKLLSMKEVQGRFNDIMGKKAPQFMASITNAVSGNRLLQQCDANSVMSAAFVAATYDLPIDGNLGFAAIVPYGNKAQYQLMYRGFVQLAIRTGAYEKMNVAEVYQDELEGYNPITGEVTFVEDFSKCAQRDEGADDKIIGYYAWFRLKSGFTKELYMTKKQVLNHAEKYSRAYRSDIEKGRKDSRWSQDFDAMAKKTVIKQLLSKWGILSTEMQSAIVDDQKVFGADGAGSYADNKDDIVDPDAPVDALAEADKKAAQEVQPESKPAEEKKPVKQEPVKEAAKQEPAKKQEAVEPPAEDYTDDFMAFDSQYESELPFR